jgi:hypothetical protein
MRRADNPVRTARNLPDPKGIMPMESQIDEPYRANCPKSSRLRTAMTPVAIDNREKSRPEFRLDRVAAMSGGGAARRHSGVRSPLSLLQAVALWAIPAGRRCPDASLRARVRRQAGRRTTSPTDAGRRCLTKD